LPGALILGLLASLLAHTASYGGAHATGGVYHEALLTLAVAGAVGFGLLLGLAAWFNVQRLAEGSVLAARLQPLVPGVATAGVFSTAWFYAIEAAEVHHAQAPAILVVIALVAAATALCRLAQLVVRAIAHAVVAFVSQQFANRRPAYVRRFARLVRINGAAYSYRRHARPPPAAMLVLSH
jgi:hypothetical protein